MVLTETPSSGRWSPLVDVLPSRFPDSRSTGDTQGTSEGSEGRRHDGRTQSPRGPYRGFRFRNGLLVYVSIRTSSLCVDGPLLCGRVPEVREHHLDPVRQPKKTSVDLEVSRTFLTDPSPSPPAPSPVEPRRTSTGCTRTPFNL